MVLVAAPFAAVVILWRGVRGWRNNAPPAPDEGAPGVLPGWDGASVEQYYGLIQ